MADEYIRKADAKDALQEKVFHNLTDEFYGAMQAIDELPPADVAPVVHVHWKDNKNGTVSCSRCSTWFQKEREPYLRFCGYCGAKMDGEE